ncbi:LacI family DNA-binding transcriptional regulator [Belliella marina]|uniref:LacI family DNA-binding transcriptional regulator n=1 Tax=Belliella marina TaxID=1644146 RepID=A0ABW4VQ99_9BACT
MKKKKISIADIAKATGVSTTTVSFVINKKAKNNVSTAVIEKVEKYIKEIGYKPNLLAKGLRTGKTNIIVFMVEDISDRFFSSIARLMEEKAYKNGYKLIFCSTENDTERSRELLTLFKDRQVDGFIITPPVGFEEEVKTLIEEKIPVVLFDRYFEDIEVSHVVIDNMESMFKSVNSVFGKGCRNVAFITTDSKQSQMMGRLSGYEKAVRQHGAPRLVKEIPFFGVKEKSAVEEIQSFLDANPGLDGMVFSTNYLTKAGLKVLKNNKISIPGDMAVLSFDDDELFELYTPTISALSQPVESIADKLMESLLKQLNGKAEKDAIIQTELMGSLIERESTG